MKEVSLVVIDRSDYIKKMKVLLENTNTYRPMYVDPTNKQKKKLINILRRIKIESGMEDITCKKMYPTGASSPKLYGLPEIHKKNNPLRPIVSSRGSVMYGVAKELAKILKPLTGNTIYHVNNSKEFADDMKKTRLEEGECIISYDVFSLFTSITVTFTVEIIKNKLEQDTELPKRTTMSANHILELLEFCSCITYFLFQGQFYEQTKGAAMGSPVSSIVANLYMEAFEHRAITLAVNPPRLCKRYEDDTFGILQQSHKEEFLLHINSVDPSIIFTTLEARPDGSMPFLNTLITPQQDGILTTSVYRKPTHTDLYLQWDSHDNLGCKYNVINTLTHRAKAVCSYPQLLTRELKYLQEVLTKCKYPKWAFDKVLQKYEDRRTENRRDQGRNTNQTIKKCHIVYLIHKAYIKATKPSGVQVHLKEGTL